MLIVASAWSSIVTWVGVALMLGFGLYMFGLALAQVGLILLAVTVYPAKFVGRSYRIWRETRGEFDGDGYRKVRDKSINPGFHYDTTQGVAVYPLVGGWPKKPFQKSRLAAYAVSAEPAVRPMWRRRARLRSFHHRAAVSRRLPLLVQFDRDPERGRMLVSPRADVV